MTTEIEKAKTGELSTMEQQMWRRPRYDVIETDDDFEIKVSMPGVNRDAVDISVDGESLNISGSLVQKIPENWRPLRRELPQGDYRLSLRLNVPVNEEKIQAHVENGVLELTLPKADAVKPRKIKIH